MTGTGAASGPHALAVVRAPIAPLLAEPHIASEQTSQTLRGHSVRVLEHDGTGDWHRVRARDGYEGWTHRGYLAPTEPHAERMLLDEDDELDEGARLSLGCTVRTSDGVRRALPLGALVTPEDELIEGDVIALAWRAGIFQPRAGAIVQTAMERFEGARYEWGGITPWGADCSGFVQMVFWLHGIQLLRDASQQATQGTDAGTTIETLAAADLLFFSDRADNRISHVGIAAGDGRIVHCALGRGGWAVDDLSDGSDEYVAKLRASFRFARTILP